MNSPPRSDSRTAAERLEYSLWIEEAKQAETRELRITKAVRELMERERKPGAGRKSG